MDTGAIRRIFVRAWRGRKGPEPEETVATLEVVADCDQPVRGLTAPETHHMQLQ